MRQIGDTAVHQQVEAHKWQFWQWQIDKHMIAANVYGHEGKRVGGGLGVGVHSREGRQQGVLTETRICSSSGSNIIIVCHS